MQIHDIEYSTDMSKKHEINFSQHLYVSEA